MCCHGGDILRVTFHPNTQRPSVWSRPQSAGCKWLLERPLRHPLRAVVPPQYDGGFLVLGSLRASLCFALPCRVQRERTQRSSQPPSLCCQWSNHSSFQMFRHMVFNVSHPEGETGPWIYRRLVWAGSLFLYVQAVWSTTHHPPPCGLPGICYPNPP